jgi:2-keto-4-pentenoate hydratase/2-oxohepta-3-ene-1,7-dioic acid hydratase in catechol pathway
MKLVTFEVTTTLGRFPRVGAWMQRGVVDLVAAFGAVLEQRGESRAAALASATLGTTMIDFFAGGRTAGDAAAEAVEHAGSMSEGAEGPGGALIWYSPSDVRLLAPIPRPPSLRDFTGYKGHLEDYFSSIGVDTDVAARVFTERPMYYKANAAMVLGPGDVVPWPSLTRELDFEIELAVVIGRGGRDIPPEAALDHVGGYTILNDISLRDVQRDELSVPINLWGVSKCKDAGMYPLGPCIATPDELPSDPVDLIVRVNGEEWVRESTSEMTWSFADIISYASLDEPLRPGDVLAGGAPPGGCGAEIGRSLSPEDVCELEIPEIGILRNTIGRPAQ